MQDTGWISSHPGLRLQPRREQSLNAEDRSRVVNLQIIEVPSPLGLRPSGLEHAPDALRSAGLHERLGCPNVVRIEVPSYSDVRDPATEILNPQSIAAVALHTADAVTAALDTSRFPVVLGGDCSIVLGPLLALRRRGRYGLAFLDGHADFQHPREEPNGEVASLDLAVATGRGPGVLADLDGLRPLVRDGDVALIGYRVLDDNDHFLDEHIRTTAVTVADLSDIQAHGAGHALERALTTLTGPELEGFWVHLDVDVLDDALMPAVDYRHPGGLSWEEAEHILGGLLGSRNACGLEVTIFNPRLDPDGSIARRLSELIEAGLQRRPRLADGS
jgi:arginase